MDGNVGRADQIARFLIGALLIAFAAPIGFPETGWNWIGWIGIGVIQTAIFSNCPAYSAFGISTAAKARPHASRRALARAHQHEAEQSNPLSP
jgi:hypothetical protein